MKHRHLTYASDKPAGDLSSTALLDILDRGDLTDWQPIVAAIRGEPNGRLAERIAHLIEAHPMYGTTALLRAWIDRVRQRPEVPGAREETTSLASLRRRVGLTQAQLAVRVGMSQSDLSKFERRGDVRVSTLRSYIDGLGGKLRLVAYLEGSTADLCVGVPDRVETEGVPLGEGSSAKAAKAAPTLKLKDQQ